MELDHIFICVPSPRAHVDTLVAAGFAEGSGNVHDGQGTANVRFFFDNAYLEILWATNESELRSDAVAPTCLSERMRWRDTGACPFGVAFREAPPWPPTWEYRAPFFSDGRTIPFWNRPGIATDPIVFAMAGRRPDATALEPLRHLPRGGDHYEITAVELCCTAPPWLPPSLELGSGGSGPWRVGPLLIRKGRRYGMKLVLRSNAGPLYVSFEPELPLDIVAG